MSRNFLDPYGTGADATTGSKPVGGYKPTYGNSGPSFGAPRKLETDPYDQNPNPDAWIAGVPENYAAQAGNRARFADLQVGHVAEGGYPGTGPMGTQAPGGATKYNNPGGYSTSAQAQADRDREALWRQEDRDRDRDWRAEDRTLDERLRAEAEAKAKEDRLKQIAAYDAYDTQMRDVYSSERVNSRFDPMVTAAGGAYDSGVQRLGGITEAMTTRGEQSRGDVANAFSAGDQRLQALRQQYQTQQGTMDSGFNDILSGYGAGNVDQGSGYMDRLFANAQTGNARAGTVYDASYADRGALVGGLQGDVETGMTQQKTAMLAQIAAQRLAAQQQSDSSLAQALAQSGIARGNL
jgi:hypothetical protein